MKVLAVSSLTIPEVKVIRFGRFADHRGYFTEHFRQSDFRTHPELAFLRDADAAIGLESPVRMLTELLQLAHAVLPWGLARFESGIALDDVPVDVPVDAVAEPVVTDADAKTPPLPALTHDTRIRRDAEGIWISRIGSARRIYINAIGHELLLLMPGFATTLHPFPADEAQLRELHIRLRNPQPAA